MHVYPLAIPLPALLGVPDGGGSAFTSSPRFALHTSADLSPVLAGEPGVRRVVFPHGSGFPFTDATSHQLWAVGFPDIFSRNKEVEHPHVPSIVIHLKLSALESRKQTRTDVPAPLEREPVAIRDAIPMMGRLAIDGLHQ